MEEQISVIVAIYNIEKFLNKCIESIVKQTYKNLEIILVDDGSDDESSIICDNWKEKDNRIKVIHKQNEGVAIARNTGLKNVTGKYITFVDGDDYIESDLIEMLYKNLLENNTQIAVGGYIYEDYSGERLMKSKEDYITNSEDAIRRMIMGDDMYIAVWGKIYKKEIFDGIEFPVGQINEDLETTYKLFDKAEKISHIAKAKYHYVQRNGSIMHTKFKIEQTSVVEFKENLLKLVEKKYPNIVDDAERFLMSSLNWCTVLTYKNKFRREYKTYKKKLKEYLPRFLKNSTIQLRVKIKSILIVYCGFAIFYNR